ncbi:MAG: hypothetical protein ACRDL7_10630, partial [Gaiellaceae bacterium]
MRRVVTPAARAGLQVRSLLARAAVVLACLIVLPAAAHAAPARAPGAAAAEVDPHLMRELVWRSVGPANMGGRIAAIAATAGPQETYYVGFGTGGVFKSENGGTTWKTIWDKQPVASIGAIAI